jgi:Plasmid pRiA4b ORF-3-like protein
MLHSVTMPKPPAARPVALRIELRVVEPLVWRRVLVSNQWTLASLHHYLQWVLGWNDSHAHEFLVGDGMVAPDWWIHEVGTDSETGNYRDERRVSVAAVDRRRPAAASVCR